MDRSRTAADFRMSAAVTPPVLLLTTAGQRPRSATPAVGGV